MKNSEIINQIQEDAYYDELLQGSKAILSKELSLNEQVAKLNENIELVTKELQKRILDQHNDLLQQGYHATLLEKILNTMNSHVENLVANADRIKIQITESYDALQNCTRVLSRIHMASHILRKVSRIHQLCKKLNITTEPVQKATILFDLEQLAEDDNLTGIEAITPELRTIKEQRQKMIKLANALLTQGVSNENSTQSLTALQIFINLGIVKSHIENFVEIALAECKESFRSTFNVRSNLEIGNSSKPGPGRANLSSTQGFKKRLWSDLEKVFSDEIHKQCKHVKFLQGVLNTINKDFTDLAAKFWSKLGTIISQEIADAAPAIQQTLEEDYPVLLKYYFDMRQKLSYTAFKFHVNIFERCENAYLGKCWTRLLDPTQAMFSEENSAPNHDQIDAVIRVISSELSLALVDPHLTERVARNISKSIRLFAVKTEQILATGPDASQVIAGSLNSSQLLNMQLSNSMHYLQMQILRMLSNMSNSLPEGPSNQIRESLSNLNSLTSAILDPLVTNINETIETILITMHLETDWDKLPVSTRITIPCSPYMRELVEFINRVYPIYLSNFENKAILGEKCNKIVQRCIALMVRHACILRPIGQGGRVRLQADFSHLENSLKILCPYLTDLGQPYRLFKSVAIIITQNPQEIVDSHDPMSSVPFSTVLFLLFSFASSELASPHQNTGWSIKKLSMWLDEHPSEADRLDIIAGALQRYETIIRQKNLTNFDPVYPIMSTFLQKAVFNN